jgi:drug/metabolite transporter (DMT)-like permease
LSRSDLALVLVSALLHALWSLAIKGSTSPLGFNVLQLAPTAIAACALPWLVPLGELPGSIWALAAGTGVAHGLYLYWLSRALADGELSVVYPIARSAPAFVPLVAAPLLGESVSAGGALGIAVVMAGMWAVQLDAGAPLRARAAPSGWRRLLVAPGVGWAWLTLIASIGYSLVDKAAMAQLGALPWRGAVPPAVAWYVILCTSGMLVFAPLALRQVPPRALAEQARREWRAALLASLVTFASYGLILHALRTAPVSYVVAVRQASVLFAVALGALRLRERPTRLRLAGALATVVGVALVAAS